MLSQSHDKTEISELLKDYEPNQEAIKLLRNTKLILFAGTTSSGKNTIMRELLKTGDYYDLVTSTTRPARENDGVMEVDGQDYHFISTEQAVENIRLGNYIEVSNVHEKINGLTVDELKRAHDSGKIVMADVDVQGVDIYKRLSPNSVIAIFILPPDYETWHKRMVDRYKTHDSFEEVWPIRRASAIKEIEFVLRVPYYHFVVNDLLDDAVDSCRKVIASDDSFHRKDDEKRLLARDLLADIKAND